MGQMAEAKAVEEALQKAGKQWSGAPSVESLRIEIGDDHTGDPSIFVTAVLAESTKKEQWTSANLDPFIDILRTAAADAGSERWVYVRFLRPSELKMTA